MADTFLMIVNSALIAWMPSFERGAGVKDLPRSGDAVVLGVPGMDPGLEVQVLCGASWKQPQAEGNCTQVGRRETIRPGAVRPCGEEAGGALQHRT
jgi:hypothetical protein